jgi:hypothetical protein
MYYITKIIKIYKQDLVMRKINPHNIIISYNKII